MADPAHEATEDIIKLIERRIAKEYRRAEKEIGEKLDDYLRRFEKKDKTWQRWVEEGKKTQEEYEKWRVGQIAVGKLWEEKKNAIAKDMHNANLIARSIARGHMPEVYAVNFNYARYMIEHTGKIDTSFSLYSREVVEWLMRDNPNLLPSPGVDLTKRIYNGLDIRWNRQQLQSLMMQALLQGEDISAIADRISKTLGEKNHKAAIRNARTMATGSQNAGRYDSFKRAEDIGIDLVIEWAATLDERTRTSHRMLHGQRRKVGQPFEVDGIKILYPADCRGASDIPQSMIWNCRCTLLAWVKGYEHDTIKKSSKMGDLSYEDWLKEKPVYHPIDEQEKKRAAEKQKYINEYMNL